tara:strand:- start:5462 stop:6046 length:585 start_codon:yes stop_codon:yes gene_type:complete
MSINSPLTEYFIEPFDSYLESKNNLKYNKFALVQLSFIFLIISFYYHNTGFVDRSGLIYLLAYYMFYKFTKSNKLKGSVNEDIKTISDITYFIINTFIIIYIIDSTNYPISTIIILFTILILTFLSYAIKFNNFKQSENKKLNDWKHVLKTTCKSMYPNNDSTKKHHVNKFWKVFDFSTLSFIIFLLISQKSIS